MGLYKKIVMLNLVHHLRLIKSFLLCFDNQIKRIVLLRKLSSLLQIDFETFDRSEHAVDA